MICSRVCLNDILYLISPLALLSFIKFFELLATDSFG